MYFVYSFLLTLGFLILLPRFLFDAFRHGKYVAGFRERLGILTPIKGNQRPVIWLHCVSVGETQAARPLVQSLQGQFPEYALAVSTITVTGQRLAREIFKNSAVKVFYFPFDWGFTTRRALNRINPVVVLLMETELWPGFLRKCSQRNIPVAVVNGRLSERSFRRYRLIKPFISRVLRSLEMALMQTDEDAERICGLGLSKDKIFVSGSLKFDAGTIPLNSSLTEELRQNFDSPVRPLLLAASTHASEERILIEAFRRLQSDALRRPRLLIAPRHPERFAEVASLMAASGFLWTRRTTAAPGHAGEHDLILLDTIGELPAAYPLAEIVFVGGSITKNGGHNLLEPAALGSCIVTGAHTFNFTAIVKTFAEADAIIQLPPLSEAEAEVELAKVFSELLAEATRRKGLGQRAKALVQENLGATDRTVKLIEPIFTRTTGMSAQHEPPTQKVHSA